MGGLTVEEVGMRLQHTMRAEPHVFDNVYDMYEELDNVFGIPETDFYRGTMEDGKVFPQNVERERVATGDEAGQIYKDLKSDPRIFGARQSDLENPDSIYYIPEGEEIERLKNTPVETPTGNGGGASGTDVIETTEEVNERKENRGGSQRTSHTNVVAPNTTTVVNRQDNSYNGGGGDSTNILGTQKAVV